MHLSNDSDGPDSIHIPTNQEPLQNHTTQKGRNTKLVNKSTTRSRRDSLGGFSSAGNVTE